MTEEQPIPEALEKQLKEQLRRELKWLNAEVFMFLKDNPMPFLIKNYNASKQVMVEMAFSELTVENPEKKKRQTEAYIR